VDTGDFVIIINAEKARRLPAQQSTETVYHHTGWPGALKSIQRQQEAGQAARRAIRRVVARHGPHTSWAMPSSRSSKSTKAGEPPHSAQQPITFTGGVQERGDK